MTKASHRWISIAAALVAALACAQEEEEPAAHAQQHEALVDQECAVCGMSVASQSAPRAQVLHRDGTRLFFCSLADWRVHLGAPSPHGRAVASFVEVLDPDENPALVLTQPHDWVPAQTASFLVGVQRPGVMGRPLLAYRDREQAESLLHTRGNEQVLNLASLETWWNEVSQ